MKRNLYRSVDLPKVIVEYVAECMGRQGQTKWPSILYRDADGYHTRRVAEFHRMFKAAPEAMQ